MLHIVESAYNSAADAGDALFTAIPWDAVAPIRASGSENREMALADLMAQKLQNMRNKHAITLEYPRCGALKGVIFERGTI